MQLITYDIRLMTFTYDGAGNRVAKYVSQSNDTGSVSDNDYYVRDAQGNILATYHETQQYKASYGLPIAWVNPVNTSVRTGLGSAHTFNSEWTVPQYATNGNFTAALLSESVEYPSFVSAELSSPVSKFMNNSSAVYTNMLMNSPAWVVPATQYDAAGGHALLFQPCLMNTFSLNNTSLGTPFLANLFGNPNPSMNQYVLGLMCTSGDMTLINALAVLMGRPTDQVCATEAASLMPFLPAAPTLMSMFHTLATQHASQFKTYMIAISTDNTIYTDPYYSTALPSTLQPIVNTYGIHTTVTTFFDSWSGGHSELTTVNSANSPLTVKYNESPITKCFRACPDGSGYPLLLLAGYAQSLAAVGYPLLSLTLPMSQPSPRPQASPLPHCPAPMCCRKTTTTLPSMTSTGHLVSASNSTTHHSSMLIMTILQRRIK